MKMIFVSTSCLRERSVKKVLQEYAEFGIKNIELGSSHKYEPGIEEFLRTYKREDVNLIIHSYFPAPEQDFAMNLASQNPEILRKSMEQAKKAIDLCHALDFKLYSINPGMRVNPDPNSFGHGLVYDRIAGYEESFQVFTSSIREICDYAMRFGINIAVENHELSEKNLVRGKNELLIMTEAEEFIRLVKEVNKRNLGILVDLGHLNVTSRTLNFDKDGFVDKLRKYVSIFHLHTNDGLSDQHKPVEASSWGLQILKQRKFDSSVPIVIESKHDSVEDILKTKRIIEEALK